MMKTIAFRFLPVRSGNIAVFPFEQSLSLFNSETLFARVCSVAFYSSLGFGYQLNNSKASAKNEDYDELPEMQRIHLAQMTKVCSFLNVDVSLSRRHEHFSHHDLIAAARFLPGATRSYLV
jgi:hypothetical protein